MVLANGIYTGFRPKFKNLDEDRERYLFAILDLHEASKIEQSVLESAEIAYELRSGKAMRRLKPPSRPTGPQIDESDFARHLPRIAKAVDWSGDA